MEGGTFSTGLLQGAPETVITCLQLEVIEESCRSSQHVPIALSLHVYRPFQKSVH